MLVVGLSSGGFAQTTSELSELEERLVLGGDQLRITLEEDPALNGTYPVSGDGTIDLGELGRAQVGDKTVDEAAEALKQYLERKYFKIATVSVSISEFVSGNIRITGPGGAGGGTIPSTSDSTVTLFEAIIQTGGLGGRADMSLVKILRWKPGGGLQREIITVDVQDMFEKLDFTNDEYLRPRDIVYIPNRGGDSTSEILYIGDVGAVGYHPHYEGMNVLRFIATTGGVPRSAQAESARILRPNGSGDYTPIPINITLLLSQGDMSQNKELRPGDIVYVPARELASAEVFLHSEKGCGRQGRSICRSTKS